MSEMEVFFEPKSIAIIGASESLKFGYWMTKYLLNSNFITYPVNIAKDKVFGEKTYKNIKDIPDEIDLAVIIVGNDKVLDSVKDCVDKGVKGIIIETAGFAETGISKYTKIQKKLGELTENTSVRIIGPNCVGITNFQNNFTTAEVDFKRIKKGGSISVIAQSGVLGNIFIDWAESKKIGFSKSITLGNKIDVDESDMLAYLEKDSSTKVITLYLEGVKRGPVLLETLKKMTKPIIILKNGRSKIGSNAIKSHTGSIAGNDKIFASIFSQFPGVFRVDDFYEMFNIAQAFANAPLPEGKNIAIITTSGSLGILACDQIEKYGLTLASLENSTIEKMKTISPNWTSVINPVDLGPSFFMTFGPSLEALLTDKNVDALLLIFAIPRMPLESFSMPISPYIRKMKQLSSKYAKPIIICIFGSQWVIDFFLEYKEKYKLPMMTQIKHSIKAFKFMYEFQKRSLN